MKILFLTRLFYPHIGGVEKHVLEISKCLYKKGYSVSLVTETLYAEDKLIEYSEIENIYKLPLFKENLYKKFKIWKWFWENKYMLEQADIIHCHDVFFWYLPFRFYYPFKKVFITFHGYEQYPISYKAIIIRKISEVLANGTICVGDFIKKWYYARPNFIIYGGVSVKKFKKMKLSRYAAYFIGRLDQHTGVLEYSKAVEKIRKLYKTFTFDVYGEGVYKKQIQNIANKIQLTTTENIPLTKYRYAFVSRYLSILEAMASKRLVFALYDNPIKKDYLTLSPFAEYIILCDSSEMLTKKVLYFLNKKTEEQKIIKKAYKFAQKNSWEKVTETYEKLWKNY